MLSERGLNVRKAWCINACWDKHRPLLHIFAYICFPSPKTPIAAPPHLLHRCYILILQKLLLKKKKKRRKNLCLRVICSVITPSFCGCCVHTLVFLFFNLFFSGSVSLTAAERISPFSLSCPCCKDHFQRWNLFFFLQGFFTGVVAPKKCSCYQGNRLDGQHEQARLASAVNLARCFLSKPCHPDARTHNKQSPRVLPAANLRWSSESLCDWLWARPLSVIGQTHLFRRPRWHKGGREFFFFWNIHTNSTVIPRINWPARAQISEKCALQKKNGA